MTRLINGRELIEQRKRNFLESFSDFDDALSCDGSKRMRGHDEEHDDWSLDIHRDFVSVIFSTGLHISSPSVILENMTLKSEHLNSERIKSRLQKFRKKPEKARDEFIAGYDLAVVKLYTAINEFSMNPYKQPDIQLLAKQLFEPGFGCLLHAEPAAFLTVSSIHSGLDDISTNDEYPLCTVNEPKMSPVDLVDRYSFIELPTLNEDEKKTPLGALFCYIMGTFVSLKQHILDNRTQERFNNPGEICKHDMKFPPMTSLPSSSALSSKQNITIQCSKATTTMDIETVMNNYYVYEPPSSSLKRTLRTSNIWNDSVPDCMSTSSHSNSVDSVPLDISFEKADPNRKPFQVTDTFTYQVGFSSVNSNSRRF